MAGQISEMFVSVGADLSDFEKQMKNMENELKAMTAKVRSATGGMGNQFDTFKKQIDPIAGQFKQIGMHGGASLEQIQTRLDQTKQATEQFRQSLNGSGSEMGAEWQKANTELRIAQKEFSTLTSMTRQFGPALGQTITESMKPMFALEGKAVDIKKKFADIALNPGQFKGDTDLYMSAIKNVGLEQKKLTDEMMKFNSIAKIGLIKTAGTMLAASTQSEKMAANFERIGNPLQQASGLALGFTHRLEKMAKAGTAAVLALKELGPNANMKELNDQMRLINMGLMRFQMVSLAAGIAAAMFYGALHQGAMQNEAYAASFKNMTAKFSEAMQPLVDVFAAIMIHVFNFIAYVSELIIKFNEAHPILSKIIAGFLLLIPALTLLLAPLAVGISMFGSFAAAFNATWMLIGPLVTGLAAISGPVLLIAAAIALAVAGLVLLWNKTTWFKDAVLGAWEAIKSGIMTAWDATVKFLTPAVKAIIDFFVQQWDGIVKFWGEIWPSMKKIIDVEFGAIIVIITTVGGAIVKYMQWAWPYISEIIKNVWNVIKSIVSGVLNILKGIIKTFIGVISGDWKLAWEGIKQVIGGAWEIIKGTIKGAIGIIQTVLKAAGDGWSKILGAAWEGIKKGADSAWTGIKTVVLNVWDSIVTGVKGYINAIIRAMNFMINGLNKVSFSVPDWVPQIGGKKFGFSIGTIPALAEGGITTGPTLAMIGEGKEQEAVLPLSKLQALLDGNGGGGITIEKMEVRSDNDIVRIAQELYRLQNRRGRSAGVIMP